VCVCVCACLGVLRDDDVKRRAEEEQEEMLFVQYLAPFYGFISRSDSSRELELNERDERCLRKT
jgi:hypothetical protein